MKKIQSKQLGELIQNEKLANWWHSQPIQVPLLENELTVTYMDFDPENDPKFIEEADQALKNFLQFQSIEKLKLASAIYENFVDVSSYLSEADIPSNMKGAQPLSIWNFVQPTQIFLNRRLTQDQDIYLVLACECDWEPEHGLQLVFRQGKKLTRVSDQDGHLTEADAYNMPDSEDSLLSAF